MTAKDLCLLASVVGYTEEPLVSMDFKHDSHSTIVDALSTDVMEKRLVKIIAWYDNEWGYSTRTVEITKMIADKL